MRQVFNFSELVYDLDIHAGPPGTWDCEESRFMYPAAGRVVTGGLKLVSDSRVRYMVSEGPRCRSPGISGCRSQHVPVESSSLLHHSIYL